MTYQTPVQNFEKNAKIWLSRRECMIAVKISYQMQVQDGCKIYQIDRVDQAA
jgi:hypothetical protein